MLTALAAGIGAASLTRATAAGAGQPRVLRTPDARFRQLPGYAFRPHYQTLRDPRFGRLRMHYVDEGPRQAPVMLLLHGQGTWAYLYREMIPALVGAGFRVVVPDYIGFGRSDKPALDTDYRFEDHVVWLTGFLSALELRQVTPFMFDWGGYFGLRIAADHPGWFDRLVLSNTMLPRGMARGRDWFVKWRAEQLALPRFPQGEMVATGVQRPLAADVIAAYDAPYPDEIYKAGPRRFPLILPIEPDDPASIANAAAWDRLASWHKPVLTLFSGRGAGMPPGPLQAHLPGAAGQAHEVIADASFYIVEDQPARLVDALVRFARG